MRHLGSTAECRELSRVRVVEATYTVTTWARLRKTVQALKAHSGVPKRMIIDATNRHAPKSTPSSRYNGTGRLEQQWQILCDLSVSDMFVPGMHAWCLLTCGVPDIV